MKHQLHHFLLFMFLLFIIEVNCTRQLALYDFRAARTTEEMRTRFYQEVIEKTIHENLALPLNSDTEPNWQSAFWALELTGYRSDKILTALQQGFVTIHQRSTAFQRALLEVVYTLYPHEFSAEIRKLADETSNAKLFAMAIHYLRRNKPEFSVWLTLLQARFPDGKSDPILHSLALTLQDPLPIQKPALRKILIHLFGKDQPVLFSLQRPNRNFPGILVVRSAAGKFLRQVSGAIFPIPQLARSLSNLPGYLTNGNTPQGIHSFYGFLTSENEFIGPVPTLQLRLPYEATVSQFFHQSNASENWSQELYRQLLPSEWQHYPPIYEAFFAGQAGRTEIIAHGSTIQPEFYRQTLFYPFTPALGCLTALELWSEKNGTCLVSGQLELINLLRQHHISHGFLVVLEIDDKPQPVTLSELLPELLRAEAEFKF